MARVQIIDDATGAPFDLNTVAPWDGEGFSVTPGEYVFTVESVFQGMSGNSKPQLELGLVIVQGLATEAHNGQQMKHWVSLTKAAAGRLRNFLDATGLAPDAEGGFDDAELVGRQFIAEVWEDEYQKGINTDGSPHMKKSTKLRKERPVEGAAQAEAPAPAPAPAPIKPTAPARPIAPAKPAAPSLPRVASNLPIPGQRVPLPARK
jgi:hypothetical protein